MKASALTSTAQASIGHIAAKISTAATTSISSFITSIDLAINKVSEQRADLGAMQNRLEHTIKNLDVSSENLQASESRIRDVDMAKEMMNFTKLNILNQAATAMLAQANQVPQGVLQLLR
jgi:flagellin